MSLILHTKCTLSYFHHPWMAKLADILLWSVSCCHQVLVECEWWDYCCLFSSSRCSWFGESRSSCVWHLTSEALNVLASVESLLLHLDPILLCVSLHVSLSVSLCVTVCVTACVSSWWQNSCWALLFVGWLGRRSLVVTNRTLCPPGHYSVFTDLVRLV